MENKVKKLVEKFELKSKEVKNILDKGEGITSDEIDRAKGLNSELSELREQITQMREINQSLRGHEKFLNHPVTSGMPFSNGAEVLGIRESGRTVVGSSGILDQNGEGLVDEKTARAISSNEYKHAFRRYLRKGEWGLSHGELKTLQVGSDAEGGFLVPDDMLSKLIEKEAAPTSVANHVTKLNTSRDNLLIPRVEYSGDDIYSNGMRVTWTGEMFDDEKIHQVKESQFGQLSIPVHTAMMSLRVTNDMVEDSYFPIQSWIADKFRETVDIMTDQMILSGSGVGQPTGILTGAGDPGKVGKCDLFDQNDLSQDLLTKMAFALPEQYAAKARWVFNLRSTALKLAQMADKNGRPLWGTGLQDAGLENGYMDRRLLGMPVLFSSLMADCEAGKPSVVFGDLSGYYLVRRTGFSVQVLREVEALRNRLVLVGRMRFGGAVAEPWKMRVGS